MKISLIVLVIIASIVAVIVIQYPSGTWRYKLTVAVDTPEGIKTGSAVREVFAYRYPKIFPDAPSSQIRLNYGEAVVVDLGKRGVLFALTTENTWGLKYSKMLPFLVFSKEEGSLKSESIRKFKRLKAGPQKVDKKWYPDFAHFKDINNRKSVARVSPENLSSAFGEGVSLKSIEITMTEEPITKGVVDKYLPWLETWKKELAQRPGYINQKKEDWEGADDPEFSPSVIVGLKRAEL